MNRNETRAGKEKFESGLANFCSWSIEGQPDFSKPSQRLSERLARDAVPFRDLFGSALTLPRENCQNA
jgi:hypothetical protein